MGESCTLFCTECGDCLDCYGEDPCPGGGGHSYPMEVSHD